MFSFATHADYSDIGFPCFSFWDWPEAHIDGGFILCLPFLHLCEMPSCYPWRCFFFEIMPRSRSRYQTMFLSSRSPGGAPSNFLSCAVLIQHFGRVGSAARAHAQRLHPFSFQAENQQTILAGLRQRSHSFSPDSREPPCILSQESSSTPTRAS